MLLRVLRSFSAACGDVDVDCTDIPETWRIQRSGVCSGACSRENPEGTVGPAARQMSSDGVMFESGIAQRPG